MKAAHVIELAKWVERNRTALIGGNMTQQAVADKATGELRFKVPTSSLVDVLKASGIETRRRSETSVKIDQLTIQRDQYRQWLLRCIDAAAVRDWLLDEMKEEFHSDAEIVKAIARKRNGDA